jgi:hypothetical protein
MALPYAEYRNTPLWRALDTALTELEATGELKVETAPDYVIGYLCQELTIKWMIASSALTKDP